MEILYLGPRREHLLAFLSAQGDVVRQMEDRIEDAPGCLDGVDWIVSYGYRHILKEDVIRRFPHRIVNLHVSLLPWNRGADPNLWSFLEDSPKGVTIHFIDAGIDTGPILVQREVAYLPNDTLATSYERLGREIESLFIECWPKIRHGDIAPRTQPLGGSLHRLRDRNSIAHLLTAAWDTPVRDLVGKVRLTEPDAD